MRARVPRNALGLPKKLQTDVPGAMGRKATARPLGLERKTPPRELLDRERALDRGLDVELFTDVGSLPINSRALLGSSWRAASADSQR
jgi:hypothetical protein